MHIDGKPTTAPRRGRRQQFVHGADSPSVRVAFHRGSSTWQGRTLDQCAVASGHERLEAEQQPFFFGHLHKIYEDICVYNIM